MKLLVCAVLIASAAFGQSFQGSLRGQVKDPADAAVPLAKLTLTDEGTKVSRSTAVNEIGEFIFASVTPATYTISAEAPGFKRLERHGIVVSTQTAVTVDLKLVVGQVSEKVDVVAESPLLLVADASTGQVIDQQKIVDLPNLGRNPFFTAKLAETVVLTGEPTSNRMQDQNGNSEISIAGGPVRTNNYLIDGISITDATNRAVVLPSPEAVQEVKLQSNTYDAEVGRTGGGTINTVLRSGTNSIHGSGLGYFRQTSWLANNYFSNRAGEALPDEPFRNYAGSLGGPVYIPKVYDGRNRTFFFATVEGYRMYDAAGTTEAVPTKLERSGDFSQSRATTGNGLQLIYDPLNLTPDGARTPFPGNVIPAQRLSKVGQNLAKYFPDPNIATSSYGAGNFNSSTAGFNHADQYTAKVDHEFASWIRASASYIHQTTQEPPGYRWWGASVASPGQTLLDRQSESTQANTTITPQPTTVIAIRWGFNRFWSKQGPTSLGYDLTSLGLPASLVSATRNPAFPSVTMSDFASFGGGGTNQDVWYQRNFSAVVSKFQGKHILKAGFDFRTLHDFGDPSVGPSSFSFDDVFTRANPQSTTPGTGSSLAALLLGYPSGGSQTLGNKFNDYVRYWGAFFHDDFRVTRRLTLNLGIRLEHESGVAEQGNKFITGFDPNAVSPLQSGISNLTVNGTVLYAGVNGSPTHTFNPLGVKPGPRFGFAYAADSKTAVRGGYGIFWAPLPFNLQNTLGYAQSTPIVTSSDGNATPAASLDNPYPNGLLQPGGNSAGGLAGIGQSISVFDRNTRSGGYVQQFSADLQREVGAGFVITAGFIGSHTLHLVENGRNINQLNPSYLSQGSALTQKVSNPFYQHGGTLNIGSATVTQAQLLLPFPQFSGVTLQDSDSSSARYTAGYVRVQRRFAQGLTLLVSYTRSRNYDQTYGLNFLTGNAFSTGAGGPQNAYDRNGEWAVSNNDTPNRFTTAITYELPFGRHKALLSHSRAADLVVGGWSLNVVGTAQSGYPLTITQPNSNSVFGASYQRPNVTGVSPSVNASFAQRLDGWINPAAFSQAAQFTFGNAPRTLGLRGPGQANWDVSVFKTFAITERLKAQVRGEALNATNTPMFGYPNTQYTNPQFGVISEQMNYARMIQLGIRLFL